MEEVLPALREQEVTVFLLTETCDTVGMETFSDKIRLASDAPLPSDLRAGLTLSSPAVYIYTSGTTGDNIPLRTVSLTESRRTGANPHPTPTQHPPQDS